MTKRKHGKPDEARFTISEQEDGICIAAKNYNGIRWDSVIAMPFIAVAAYYGFLYFLLPHIVNQFPQAELLAPYTTPIKHIVPLFLIIAFYLVDMVNLFHLFGRGTTIAGSIGYYSWQIEVNGEVVEITRKWLLRSKRNRLPISALHSYTVSPILEFHTDRELVTVATDMDGVHVGKIRRVLADALPGVTS